MSETITTVEIPLASRGPTPMTEAEWAAAQSAIDALEIHSGYVYHRAQDEPDTASTTSTTNYATGMVYQVVITEGTWTIEVIGHLGLRHSAGGAVNCRVSIAGDAGSNTSDNAPTTGWNDLFPFHRKINVTAGNKDIVVEAKSGDAGTTTLNNPALWISLIREAY